MDEQLPELTYEQLPEALRAAVDGVLALVKCHGCGAPVVIVGEIRGHLMLAGLPETATGIRVNVGRPLDAPAWEWPQTRTPNT